MKKHVLISLFGICALFGTSCYSEYGSVHTKRSAVVGGLVGAGAGALIGEHNDRELEGAAIGGVIGALTGGVLGSARDEEYYGRQYQAPRYQAPRYQEAPPYRSYQSVPRYQTYNYYPSHGYYSGSRGYYSPRRSSSYCR